MEPEKTRWHFNQPTRGAINREPIVGEFFSTDVIRNETEALVRESIQNSLDAACDEATVKVRFFVSGTSAALPPEKMSLYMAEGWPHFLAERNGLRDQPDQQQPCPFLTIEDFATTGLTGDIQQDRLNPAVRNPFYYFFRAEGQSGKSERDRGRWGVGKTVFPRTSRLNLFFSFTVRQDDQRRLLMGRAVLRSHSIGNEHFAPDGFFGRCDERFPLPVDDDRLIEQFRQDFRLQRENETGLSVVVPYCDDEVTSTGLIEAVIRQYYYAILAGNLQVTVASPDRDVTLTHETLLSEIDKMDGASIAELRPLIHLTQCANQQGEEQMFKLTRPSAQEALKWSSAWLSEAQVTEMRARLEKGEMLAVRIPVGVREKKQKESQPSFFEAFFIRDGNQSNNRPVFIREGIIISDIRAPRNRGYRSMVIVKDKPLATLLGDAENPAHTQWQKGSDNYKGKYMYEDRYIPFVTRSVTEIIQAITEEQNRVDPTLLLDIFSLPAQQVEDAAKTPKEKPKPKEGVEPDDIPEPPPASPRRFLVNKVEDGFSVIKGSNNATPPDSLLVQVAYNVRRGNPLKKYNPADFAIQDLKISHQGIEFKRVEKNEALVKVVDPDFALTVTGFDENRDLFVKVKAIQEDVDDPKN